MSDFEVWRAEVQRIVGVRFDELSGLLLMLLYEDGETPEAAAGWARIALTGDAQ